MRTELKSNPRQFAPGNPHSSLIPHSSLLFLQIADITITLPGDDSELKMEVDEVTKNFLVPQAAPDVRVHARWGDLCEKPGGKKIFDSGLLWRLYSEDRSYCFHFTSPVLGPLPYKIASFNREFTSGEVCFNHSYFSRSQPLYPLDYPLDELLLVNLLARGKGVEVHACGVVDSSGNGHLFVGQSGAGKTTIAKLWQNENGATVLSDDRIILRQWGNRLWMYGTPWHGEAEFASPEKAPLKSVYFLAKGIKNEMIPLKQSDAAALLFARSFPPYYDQQGLEFTLTFLAELVRSIPCYELPFRPDEKILEFINESAR